MATPLRRESENNQREAFSSPMVGARRDWGHRAFREYFAGEGAQVILDKLEYPGVLRNYVLEAMNQVVHQLPKMTDNGLEFRPSSDSTGQSKAAIIESPKPELVQLTVTPPSVRYLDQEAARKHISREELSAIKGLFQKGGNPEYLLRLVILNGAAVREEVLSSYGNLVRALHISDELPRFGLGSEKSPLSRILHKIGQKSLFKAHFDNDLQISINDPGSKSARNEVWRNLPSTLDQKTVMGRVP